MVSIPTLRRLGWEHMSFDVDVLGYFILSSVVISSATVTTFLKRLGISLLARRVK